MIANVFGKILRKYRIENQLSQEKLAFASNLDRTYISLLERGLRQPSLESLFKLSKALKIRPNEFVKRIEDNYENSN